MAELPPGVFDGASELEFLGLSSNELRELPPGSFDEQESLLSLSLAFNRLTTLPEGIFSSLSSLTLLQLQRNQLSELPSERLSALGELESLVLAENELSKLSDGLFSGLTNLEVLAFSDNQLTSLPDSLLSGLEKLRWLWLHGNPGSPFHLTLRAERTDTTDLSAAGPATIVVGLVEGAPFDMEVSLVAPGASLSQATVSIATGSTHSDAVTITRNTTTQGSVTVSLGAVPDIPGTVCWLEQLCYTGILVDLGTAITLFR